jgi:hypothetical protein
MSGTAIITVNETRAKRTMREAGEARCSGTGQRKGAQGRAN